MTVKEIALTKEAKKQVRKCIKTICKENTGNIYGSDLKVTVEDWSETSVYFRCGEEHIQLNLSERTMGYTRFSGTGIHQIRIEGGWCASEGTTKVFKELKAGGFSYSAIAEDVLYKLKERIRANERRFAKEAGYNSACNMRGRIGSTPSNVFVTAKDDGTVSVELRSLNEAQARAIIEMVK